MFILIYKILNCGVKHRTDIIVIVKIIIINLKYLLNQIIM